MSEAQQLGRYTLLRRLGGGGMAEVFLARQSGLRGFEKLVVVKRIHPHLAGNPDFVALFLEEVRAAADMNHPNVVTVFDAGREEGTYYLAMEHLRGADLGRVASSASRSGEPLPLPFVLRVVADAARGLHYAHAKTDLRGNALHLVHRDVSPQNLIVTHDGVTKVVDFGVAHLAATFEDDGDRRVKGKLPYMSPEHAGGAELTPAADQFSLGVVLYELLTGEPLFRRPTDAETLEAVLACQVPDPALVREEIPAALSGVVLRALSPRSDRRFPSCLELATALDEIRKDSEADLEPAEVGTLVRRLVPDEEGDGVPGPTPAAPVGVDESEATEIDHPSVPGTVIRHNLPSTMGSFVGREKDLDRLEVSFRGDARWVTLCGTGGIGKTRLALRHAELHLGDYLEPGSGTWLCDLTEVDSLDGLLRRVSEVLHLAVPRNIVGDEWVRSVGSSLAARGRLLLLLDNADRVTGTAGAVFEAWLGAAPSLHLLLTSRQPLHGESETLLNLEPLSIPTLSGESATSEAVRLWLDRAGRARPGYRLEPEEVPAVAEIVRRLDGLPLAIELAAARAAVMSTHQILERLDRRFALLTRGAPGAPARQATLEAAIAWSWDLLDEWERDALAQCSVFRGGFTLAAAESVLDLDSHPNAPLTIDVLQDLRERSLLRSAEGPGSAPEPRFGLFESVRDFAGRHLDDAEGVHIRHAEYFIEEGERLALAVDEQNGAAALDRLRAEVDNLLAALEHTRGDAPELAARAALALEAVLTRSFAIDRYLELTREAVASAQAADAPTIEALARRAHAIALRAAGRMADASEEALVGREAARRAGDRRLEGDLLGLAGNLASETSDFEVAFTRLEESLKILRSIEETPALGLTLTRRGIVFARVGRNDEAAADWEAAAEIHERIGTATMLCNALQNLGVVIQNREPQRALDYYERTLEIFSSLGDRRSVGSTYNNLGTLNLDLERIDEARRYYERALRQFRHSEDRSREAISKAMLMIAEHLDGDLPTARRRGQEALALCEALADPWITGITRAHSAAIEARLGNLEVATRTFEQARSELEAVGVAVFIEAADLLEGLLDLARAASADPEAADGHRQAARARLSRATRRSETGELPRVEEDVDIRLAARLLSAALQAA